MRNSRWGGFITMGSASDKTCATREPGTNVLRNMSNRVRGLASDSSRSITKISRAPQAGFTKLRDASTHGRTITWVDCTSMVAEFAKTPSGQLTSWKAQESWASRPRDACYSVNDASPREQMRGLTSRCSRRAAVADSQERIEVSARLAAERRALGIACSRNGIVWLDEIEANGQRVATGDRRAIPPPDRKSLRKDR